MSSGKSGLADLFGWRGDVLRSGDLPPAPYVDPSREAGKAIAGNLRNLPEAAELARRSDAANVSNYAALMEQLIPGYSSISGNISGSIESMSRGEIPADLAAYLGRKNAELGITTGTSGSDFDRNRLARNYGLTSLDLINRSLDSAARWMQTVSAGVPRMDFTRSFVSPELQIQNQWRNEENRWNVNWLGEQLDAQPSNAERAYSKVADYIADFATLALSYGTKSAMGGGGGGDTGGAVQGYENQWYIPMQGNNGTAYTPRGY